jgi:hypothetical protein
VSRLSSLRRQRSAIEETAFLNSVEAIGEHRQLADGSHLPFTGEYSGHRADGALAPHGAGLDGLAIAHDDEQRDRAWTTGSMSILRIGRTLGVGTSAVQRVVGQ